MKKGQKAIYDLYAVSNHFGSLNGGHYTAFARNPISNKWNDFDDSNVNKMSPGCEPLQPRITRSPRMRMQASWRRVYTRKRQHTELTIHQTRR